MKITITGLSEALFSRESHKNLYEKLIKQSLKLQPHLVEPQIKQQFALFLGKFMVSTFKKAIDKQAIYGKSFKQIYHPLNKKYNDKKIFTGTKDMFYKNSGWLQKNIKCWIKDDVVYVGFREIDRHPKSGAKGKDLLKWLDEGTIKTQSRPLLSMILDEIQGNFDVFVDYYLEFVEKRLLEIYGLKVGSDIIQYLNNLEDLGYER